MNSILGDRPSHKKQIATQSLGHDGDAARAVDAMSIILSADTEFTANQFSPCLLHKVARRI
jgi:hypothetical protein